VKRGLSDGAWGRRPVVEPEAQMEKCERVRAEAILRGDRQGEERGREFADKAAEGAGASKLPDGLVYKTRTPGNGPSPAATDKVKVNYEGRLTTATSRLPPTSGGSLAELA